MAFSAWEIGVLIRASTNATGVFSRISMGARSAQLSADLATGRINAAAAAALRMQLRMDELRAHMARMAELGAGVMAFLGGAIMLHGVSAASKLQLAMVTVGNATGATRDQLEQLRRMVLQVSGITAQSADVIAAEMAMAARSGLSSFSQLAAAFPTIARFADVQFLARGQNPVEAVNIATQFAHYFQAYKGEPLKKMLDDLNRLMFVQPEVINRLLYQGKYFIPLARTLGIGEPEIMRLLAVMGQTGFLRGRGGTAVENAITGALNAARLTGHIQNARTRALHDLGIMDTSGKLNIFDKSGHMIWEAFEHDLVQSRSRLGPQAFSTDLLNAFGKQATQFLAILADPTVQARMKQIDEAMRRQKTVNEMQKQYLDTFYGRWRQFITNVSNVAIAVFYPTLDRMAPYLKRASDVLAQWFDYLTAHPDLGLKIAIGTFGATAAAAAFAMRGVLRLTAAMGDLGVIANVVAASSSAGTAAGVGGAAAARGGLLGAIIGRFMGPLSSIAGRLGAGAVVRGAFRFFGWVGVILLAVDLLSHLPNIAKTIASWWQKNQQTITYTIGYAFGWIGKTLVSAIMGLMRSVLGIFRNKKFWEASFFYGTGDFRAGNAMMVAALGDALKNISAMGPGENFTRGLGAGYRGWGFAPHGYGVTPAHGGSPVIQVHGGIHIYPAPGTPDHIIDEVTRRIAKEGQRAAARSGSQGTLPWLSPFAISGPQPALGR